MYAKYRDNAIINSIHALNKTIILSAVRSRRLYSERDVYIVKNKKDKLHQVKS